MSADILTVMWKDLKETLSQGGGRGRFGLLIFAAVFGVFLPVQAGIAWLTEPLLLVYWVWIPLFLVSTVIADSFAGERERHTLETLLASRLSDRAILLGKIGVAVVYGWGLSIACVLLGVVTVNIANWQGTVLFYGWDVFVGILFISLLGSGLASCAGVLVSLRAATVRQAQQTLSISIMVGFFILIFGLQALPQEWRIMVTAGLSRVSLGFIIAVVCIILLLIDVALLAAAAARFKRARLILD
ncbi:MAG: hypothetical protein JW908_11180 [Anaerolineales bacterium]|nr:hypothetical protein [Anaerolineales bacterium]